MEEQNGRADVVTEVLNKYAWFYKVPKGFVLVRRTLGGTYIMGGEQTTIKKQDVSVSLRIMELSDDQLAYFTGLYNGSTEPKDQRTFNLLLEERAARQQEALSNTIIERSVALRMGTVDTVLPDRIVNITKYEQKHGIKMRLPFQDVVMVPTTELSLDTAVIKYTDERKQYEVEIDTDYKYIVEDPLLFVEKRETFRTTGSSIYKEIGDLLDNLIRDYIKGIGIENFLAKKNNNLLIENALEILEIRKNYGVMITKFFIKDINLPKKITEANEAHAVAAREGETEAIKAEAKAQADAAAFNAEIEAISQKQGISKEEAREFYLRRQQYQVQTHGGVNIVMGAQPQTTPQLEPQAAPQTTPQAAPQTTPQPAQQQNTAESLLRELSIVDDEGYLNRADSQFIAQNRRVQLEPGTVYHASELSTIEAFEIASRHRLSNPQNTQQSTPTAYTEDQIKQFAADGLCDEEGYLSRADSQLIAQNRGVQLAPGKVLHVNNLSQNDFDILRQKNNIK